MLKEIEQLARASKDYLRVELGMEDMRTLNEEIKAAAINKPFEINSPKQETFVNIHLRGNPERAFTKLVVKR